MRRKYSASWITWITVPGIMMASGVPGYAATYLSVGQAQEVLFPDESLTAAPFILTSVQAKAIQKKTGVAVRNKTLKLWRTKKGGSFIVDEVLGKHEFITYAIGLRPDGSIQGIEILDYRETYGYQIRNADWRKQFVGKAAGAPLKLGQDIKNISGATLSCRHITDGVKRLLATYEIALR